MHMPGGKVKVKNVPRRFEVTRSPASGIVPGPTPPCLDHFLDIAGNPADQVDVHFFQEVEKSVADRTADDDSDPEFFDLAGALVYGIAFHRDGSADDFVIPSRFQETELGAGIQDR
jgi:hypothetical protein